MKLFFCNMQLFICTLQTKLSAKLSATSCKELAPNLTEIENQRWRGEAMFLSCHYLRIVCMLNFSKAYCEDFTRWQEAKTNGVNAQRQ